MNKNTILKILSVTLLLASFIVFFSLFAKIRNLDLVHNIDSGQVALFVLISLSLLFTVVLFILSLLNINIQTSEDKYGKKATYELDAEKKDDKKIRDKSTEENLDVEYYSSKIIPKENSKLDLTKYTEKILSNIAKEFDIVQGLFFVRTKDSDIFNIAGKYAYFGDEEPNSFNLGETLSGQVAKNQTILNLKEIPENYITILSGLGSSSPNHLIIIPVITDGKTVAIIELASFKEFKENFKDLFQAMSERIGSTLVKF